MLSNDKIIEIYYAIDEFCKEFEKTKKGHVLQENNSKKSRNRACFLSDSEVITIMILFHTGGFRHLKHFYTNYVQVHMHRDFPRTVSYNRFVELQQKATMPMAIFLKACCLGRCTGVSFIDSTPIRACHIRRERSNKVFKGMATKSCCTNLSSQTIRSSTADISFRNWGSDSPSSDYQWLCS